MTATVASRSQPAPGRSHEVARPDEAASRPALGRSDEAASRPALGRSDEAASRFALGRAAYGLLAAALLALAVFELATQSTGLWQFFAFGAGPDLALLLGAAPGLAKGQLHPRAVPAYNLLHRFWGPAALALAAAAGLVGVGFLIGAVAWALHIAVDRTVGYGLRGRDGFQRA